MADTPDPSVLPEIAGLTDGSNPHVQGIILFHSMRSVSVGVGFLP